jgi:hypothetical protein
LRLFAAVSRLQIEYLWRLNLECPFAVQGIVEADDFTFFFHSEAAG